MFEIDYSQLKPIILHGGAIREGVRFLGIVVPDTDGLLAVDERHQASSSEFDDEHAAVWAVTHIPTMRRMQRTGCTDAENEQEAFALASRLYAACKRIGMDLTLANFETVMAPYHALNDAAREAFWAEIKGTQASEDGKQ